MHLDRKAKEQRPSFNLLTFRHGQTPSTAGCLEQPRMVQCLPRRHPLIGIDFQQLFYEILRVVRQEYRARRKFEFPLRDQIECILVCGAIEWQHPRQQKVSCHPHREHVAHVIVPSRDDLWRDEAGRSSESGHGSTPRLVLPRQAEIDELELLRLPFFCRQEEMFRFNVPMNDSFGVQVLEHVEYGAHGAGGPGLMPHGLGRGTQSTRILIDHPVEEVAAGATLHDDVHVPIVLKEIAELNNIWMMRLVKE
mmetsp:Transcript_28546/g.68699  ORF Transcript_28546/g.68699 Transcript_28546/m.68699 type:complete len:251 (-) Transcript_28546:1657-2409(-)